MLVDAAVAQRSERLDVDQEVGVFNSLQLYQAPDQRGVADARRTVQRAGSTQTMSCDADRNAHVGLATKRSTRRFLRRLFSLVRRHHAGLARALPQTPVPISSQRSGHIDANGIRIHYAAYGEGPPVVLLHGGLANADYWGNQIPALALHRTVIAMDSRGHGRSTRDLRPLGYDLMADDVVALMDALGVPKADIVGWSDGAVVALDLAMRHLDRVGKIFAYAVNTKTTGTKHAAILHPAVLAFIRRAAREYKRHSDTPNEYGALLLQIVRMWASGPDWTDEDLSAIAAPVLVVHGEHDETIKRTHVEYVAATIPDAQLLILPGTGHFAFLQNPDLFNRALVRFLDD
jgi:pimeloyl-ACP methyl ester carboxylesterase